MIKFTHLHLHTHYSLLDGLTKPSKLMSRLKDMEMDSVAITDHGNMYGVIEFYKAAKENDIKPILGCEVYIVNNMDLRTRDNNKIHHLILLAMDKEGYQNLIKLVSEANINGFYYKPRIDFKLLEKYNKGLICLSGCLGGELSQLILSDNISDAEKLAERFQGVFGDRYYIEIQRHPDNKEQCKVTPWLITLSTRLGIPMVATCDSHYLRKEDQDTHEVLLAINTGKDMDSENRFSLKENELYVADAEEMAEKFKDVPEAIENSNKIAERCNVDIDLGKIRLPEIKLPEGVNSYDEWLNSMCWANFNSKFDENDEIAKVRLKYELSVIKKTGFASYLLIVEDFVSWAKKNGISVGPGRGSAAGSIISYLLGITTIDPLKYGLLFERFMNPDRISMPDIDIDLEDTRRDEVIEYVAGKYGKENVSQIITFGTIWARTGIRDVGRVLKIPLGDCDRIAKLIPFGKNLTESMEIVPEFRSEYSKFPELIDTALKLEGVVRHASKHACGVVVADRPITDYMPVQKSREGGVMTQYEMHTIEELGLLKIDFLGLRSLSVISECVGLIKKDFGMNVDINTIPLDDSKTFKLLQEGKTTSVFQLESSGMKSYLKKLKPTDLNDITAMVSLYRPGPMELIPDYINRKHGKEKVEYLHPSLEPILKDTYGIMIYQEQLMSAVQALAGFTLAQADVLRKAVGKKIKKLLYKQESKFIQGAINNGIPKNIANKFWSLIEPFCGYGFNKSHAVGYAMIAYQTAYLKANYPIQFMVAEMNSDTKAERISELISEIKLMGINILAPNINHSDDRFVNNKNSILFSIAAIKGMSSKTAEFILKEKENGPYKDLVDFLSRLRPGVASKRSLEFLAKSGALDDLGDRNQLVGNIEIISSYVKLEDKRFLPELVLHDVDPININKKLVWEKELMGTYISSNPGRNYYYEIKMHNVLDINKLDEYKQSTVSVGGVITYLKKNVSRDGRVTYYLKLMDYSGLTDVSVYPSIYNKHSDILKVNNVIKVFGKIRRYNNKSTLMCLSATLIAEMS